MPDFHQSPSSELGPLIEKLTGESSCPGGLALATFLEKSPDPVLLFNENAELIGKNERAVQFWDGTENFIPPQLISEISKVDASGSPFHEHKKNRLVAIKSKDEQRYFLPTIFCLLNARSNDASLPYRRVIACILKDETVWERSERIRSNLLSSISHELNTPLTSARLALYLLAEQRIGGLNPKQQDLVERAKQDLDREILSIQNVIDMIRSEAIEHEPSKADDLNLHELIEEAISDFETQIRTMHLPVDRDYSSAAPWLVMERDTARLVMYQLFASIIKYSEDGAHLNIRTSVEEGHCLLELTTKNHEQTDFLPDDLFTMKMESPRTRQLRCADLGLRVAHEMVAPYDGSLDSQRFETSGKIYFRFPCIQN